MTDEKNLKKSNKITQAQKEAQEREIKQKDAEHRANIYCNPVTSTLFAIKQNYKHENLDLQTMVNETHEQLGRLRDGNTKRLETLLYMQAVGLHELFNKGISQTSHTTTLNGLKAWANIALQAQTQSRKTLALLVDIKNPRHSAVFVRQQNNAINQQINESTPATLQKLKNSGNPANELLSEVQHETVDAIGTSQTSQTNTPMEAVVKSGR